MCPFPIQNIYHTIWYIASKNWFYMYKVCHVVTNYNCVHTCQAAGK